MKAAKTICSELLLTASVFFLLAKTIDDRMIGEGHTLSQKTC